MYSILLPIHSIVRWFVLISLLYSVFRAYRGWKSNKVFNKTDNFLRHTTATIAHIQLVLGLSLYYLSPIVETFLHHFKEAVHLREIRFFGMEHSLMMLIAVITITIGSASAKRKTTDNEKFKTITLWFSIALLIILSSIPWPFVPFGANRPFFRAF